MQTSDNYYVISNPRNLIQLPFQTTLTKNYILPLPINGLGNINPYTTPFFILLKVIIDPSIKQNEEFNNINQFHEYIKILGRKGQKLSPYESSFMNWYTIINGLPKGYLYIVSTIYFRRFLFNIYGLDKYDIYTSLPEKEEEYDVIMKDEFDIEDIKMRDEDEKMYDDYYPLKVVGYDKGITGTRVVKFLLIDNLYYTFSATNDVAIIPRNGYDFINDELLKYDVQKINSVEFGVINKFELVIETQDPDRVINYIKEKIYPYMQWKYNASYGIVQVSNENIKRYRKRQNEWFTEQFFTGLNYVFKLEKPNPGIKKTFEGDDDDEEEVDLMNNLVPFGTVDNLFFDNYYLVKFFPDHEDYDDFDDFIGSKKKGSNKISVINWLQWRFSDPNVIDKDSHHHIVRFQIEKGKIKPEKHIDYMLVYQLFLSSKTKLLSEKTLFPFLKKVDLINKRYLDNVIATEKHNHPKWKDLMNEYKFYQHYNKFFSKADNIGNNYGIEINLDKTALYKNVVNVFRGVSSVASERIIVDYKREFEGFWRQNILNLPKNVRVVYDKVKFGFGMVKKWEEFKKGIKGNYPDFINHPDWDIVAKKVSETEKPDDLIKKLIGDLIDGVGLKKNIEIFVRGILEWFLRGLILRSGEHSKIIGAFFTELRNYVLGNEEKVTPLFKQEIRRIIREGVEEEIVEKEMLELVNILEKQKNLILEFSNNQYFYVKNKERVEDGWYKKVDVDESIDNILDEFHKKLVKLLIDDSPREHKKKIALKYLRENNDDFVEMSDTGTLKDVLDGDVSTINRLIHLVSSKIYEYDIDDSNPLALEFYKKLRVLKNVMYLDRHKDAGKLEIPFDVLNSHLVSMTKYLHEQKTDYLFGFESNSDMNETFNSMRLKLESEVRRDNERREKIIKLFEKFKTRLNNLVDPKSILISRVIKMREIYPYKVLVTGVLFNLYLRMDSGLGNLEEIFFVVNASDVTKLFIPKELKIKVLTQFFSRFQITEIDLLGGNINKINEIGKIYNVLNNIIIYD